MMQQRRIEFLKWVARGGLASGLAALCVMLARRKETFVCTNRCGRCEKNVNGVCELGMK
jgi:hypothetical protein